MRPLDTTPLTPDAIAAAARLQGVVRVRLWEIWDSAQDLTGALLGLRGGTAKVVVGDPEPERDQDWRRAVALYAELAAGLGTQLWVLAPHVRRDQQATLLLLDEHREAMQAIHSMRANVLVHYPDGPMVPADFSVEAVFRLAFSTVQALP